MLYFAYGSNMNTARMQSRIPTAVPTGAAFVQDRKLVCNKLGRDGSGKANLARQPGHMVHGVLYELPPEDIKVLDAIEGGYRRISIWVNAGEKKPARAETYEAEVLTHDPVPFDWYQEHILTGAREHGLPEEYVRQLEQIQAQPRMRCSETP